MLFYPITLGPSVNVVAGGWNLSLWAHFLAAPVWNTDPLPNVGKILSSPMAPVTRLRKGT
jgi:hypothetical protein